MTTSAWARTRSKMSGAQGMAAFAERPCGPFFVTSDTRAPVRAASVSAARVMTSAAFGLPLSSTPIRIPASEAGEGARCTISGPGSLSGREMVTVMSSLRGQRHAAGHAPRWHEQRVLARAARDEHTDVAGLAGHRQQVVVGGRLHPLGPCQLLEVAAEPRGRHARAVVQVERDVVAREAVRRQAVCVLGTEDHEELALADRRVVHAE